MEVRRLEFGGIGVTPCWVCKLIILIAIRCEFDHDNREHLCSTPVLGKASVRLTAGFGALDQCLN
jgi:hypothetical protein